MMVDENGKRSDSDMMLGIILEQIKLYIDDLKDDEHWKAKVDNYIEKLQASLDR